jgi:hypothetical protein
VIAVAGQTGFKSRSVIGGHALRAKTRLDMHGEPLISVAHVQRGRMDDLYGVIHVPGRSGILGPQTLRTCRPSLRREDGDARAGAAASRYRPACEPGQMALP